jgi:hypothetical protein
LSTHTPIHPRPLKPRHVLFYSALIAFLVWVGLLAWLYLTQVAIKHGA